MARRAHIYAKKLRVKYKSLGLINLVAGMEAAGMEAAKMKAAGMEAAVVETSFFNIFNV